MPGDAEKSASQPPAIPEPTDPVERKAWRKDRFRELLGTGKYSIGKAVKELGVSRTIIDKWRREDDEFDEDVEALKALSPCCQQNKAKPKKETPLPEDEDEEEPAKTTASRAEERADIQHYGLQVNRDFIEALVEGNLLLFSKKNLQRLGKMMNAAWARRNEKRFLQIYDRLTDTQKNMVKLLPNQSHVIGEINMNHKVQVISMKDDEIDRAIADEEARVSQLEEEERQIKKLGPAPGKILEAQSREIERVPAG